MITWNKENKDKLLKCKSDEDMIKAFPNSVLSSLKRKKNEFKFHVANAHSVILANDIIKENKSLKRNNSFFSLVGDSILDKIKPFEPEITKHNAIPYDSQDIFVALFSDAQVGERVLHSETGGMGGYSLEIFKDRLWNWAKGITYVNKEKKCSILHIDALGDDLDNIMIYKGQAHHIESGLSNQFIFFYEEFCKVLVFLSKHFNEIIINKVIGNHGRYGTPGDSSTMDNIEYLLYTMIKKKFDGHKNIRFNIADSWWMVVERNGWRFLLSHGDTFKGWLGIPFYGAVRNKQRMEELLNGHFKDAHFDWVEHGHFHTDAIFNHIIMNGCMPGTNDFSSRLGLGGLPMQQTFGVSKTYGVRWLHPIYLKKPDDKPKLQVYR